MPSSSKGPPGFVIAGLRGGSGKTVVSLGITSAWSDNGLKVAVFKKGPDYIDAGWLACAAGRPCHNLDAYLCTPAQVKNSFQTHSSGCDIAVVEGNRGLFDGIDAQGQTCTAELAKLLHLPVLLVVDCTKSTRTIAALILGCLKFDPDLEIMGIILNRVAGKRHETKVRDAIETFCHIPVFGAVTKLKSADFPERHMGLVTMEEHACSQDSIAQAADMARAHIDLASVLSVCTAAPKKKAQPSLPADEVQTGKPMSGGASSTAKVKNPLTIGVVKDSAFQFYYPDNIDALAAKGATIVYISPLKQKTIAAGVDAIYMGGGFPETHAPELASNHSFKAALKHLADQGLPIYAECGGFIFLGDSILLDGTAYAMARILPVSFGLSDRPAGHGYTSVKVVSENPFYAKGLALKGHEFRYSTIRDISYEPHEMAFQMDRGKGIVEKRDGFFKNNVFATYTHIHALGTPQWAEALIGAARRYKSRNSQ